jgi:hypothetical protein
VEVAASDDDELDSDMVVVVSVGSEDVVVVSRSELLL